jgi:hypothetical protein
MDTLQICPSTFVSTCDAFERCLIMVDGEPLGYVIFDTEVPVVIKNIVEAEVKRLQTIHGDAYKIHCEMSTDGKSGTVYQQRLGYVYNSRPEAVMVVKVVTVPRVSITNATSN